MRFVDDLAIGRFGFVSVLFSLSDLVEHWRYVAC